MGRSAVDYAEGLTLSAAEGERLVALLGSRLEVEHYRELVIDHCESTGKKYKSLAATIRVWWRRDQERAIERAGIRQPAWVRRQEPATRPKETAAENLNRAKLIWQWRVRERNNWLTDKKLHHHNAECQGGKVCSWADSKEPVLPMLAQVLEKLNG